MPAPAPEVKEVPDATAVIYDIAGPAVPEHWSRIEDMIRAAINASPVQPKLETPRDVLNSLVNGRYNLHLVCTGHVIEMALVTQIQHFARTKVCYLVYAAGRDQEKWVKHFQDKFCEAAREEGCRFIQMQGDEVHGKLIERCGFIETSRVYTLEI